MSTLALETLRAALASTPRFEEGTVVRWRFTPDSFPPVTYTFAALYMAGYWWLTGSGRTYAGARKFTTQEFLRDVLADATTSSIEVADSWVEL